LFAGFDNSVVAPIRGREDTEGDRDAGVKVQIDGGEASFPECLSNRPRTIRKEDKKETSWLLREKVSTKRSERERRELREGV
jgi:hypothetical protein